MGCTKSTFEEKEKDKEMKKNVKETVKQKETEGNNQAELGKIINSNEIMKEQIKEKLQEKIPEIIKEKVEELNQENTVENDIDEGPGYHLDANNFAKFEELASKSYNEDTIIYYKNTIYAYEVTITHRECIVIKTLKKAGLPYYSKFTFKSPSIIIGDKSKLKCFSSKQIICKGKRGTVYFGNSPRIESKRFFEGRNLVYEIPIEQTQDEPFVIYYLVTQVYNAYLTGTDGVINIIPFNKNNLGNPNCKFGLFFRHSALSFYGTDVTPNNKFDEKFEYVNGQKYSYLQLIGEKEDNINFLFKLNGKELTISPSETAFQSSFYDQEMIDYIKEALKKVTLKLGENVIAIKEIYNVKQKKVTVEVIKTIAMLREKNIKLTGSTIHYFKENKNIKLIKIESNHEQVKQFFKFLTKDNFRMFYIMNSNELFATFKAIYEFDISKSDNIKDIIELDCEGLNEGGLYHCSINYDYNEYIVATLKRDPSRTFSENNYYMEYFSKDSIKNGIFNEIHLHNIPDY